MEKKNREFQIFTKPVGAVCNLRCKYCYYLDKKALYQAKGSFIMNDDILERYIVQHIEASTEETISFSWHGGEPLMAGIDFFRKIINLQKKQKHSGATKSSVKSSAWSIHTTLNSLLLSIVSSKTLGQNILLSCRLLKDDQVQSQESAGSPYLQKNLG